MLALYTTRKIGFQALDLGEKQEATFRHVRKNDITHFLCKFIEWPTSNMFET